MKCKRLERKKIGLVYFHLQACALLPLEIFRLKFQCCIPANPGSTFKLVLEDQITRSLIQCSQDFLLYIAGGANRKRSCWQWPAIHSWLGGKGWVGNHGQSISCPHHKLSSTLKICLSLQGLCDTGRHGCKTAPPCEFCTSFLKQIPRSQ
jgi:hypothetical protein